MSPDGRTPQWRRDVRRARVLLDVAAGVCLAAGVGLAWSYPGATVALWLLAILLLSTAAEAARELSDGD